MPHFFINSKSVEGNEIEFSEDYKHLVKALRLRTGEKLLLIDENGIQYETRVKDITPETIVAEIEKSYPSARELDFELHLAQSPLRSDAQSLVVEKATELGVHTLWPVYTDNCALAKDVITKKIEKWQKIMVESSKQCERAKIPTCAPMTSLEKVVEGFDRVIAFCERTNSPLKTYLREKPIQKGEKVLVIIGPEGGFSEREFEFFENAGIVKASLGDLILRAETAVIVGLGNIIYEKAN
ncbi:MAG: 16S rRNA (uracil(1498)-N(3))-methyltransferase [Fusobacterium sp.]|nr:16S rRNA (uracil(1498)-N(3))-methyltransferase [Fusobacterium sp.]